MGLLGRFDAQPGRHDCPAAISAGPAPAGHLIGVISPAAILADTAHRPWPVPRGPWVMEQGWYNLLFAHWRVAAAELRALVPRELKLDSCGGETWVSITPLFIRMRPRFAFGIRRAWNFPELNWPLRSE